MWDFNVRRRLGESAKKKRVGLGWEQNGVYRYIWVLLKTLVRYVLALVAEFQMCLVATAWSECNVIPGGSPALFPKLLTLCFLQKPADG